MYLLHSGHQFYESVLILTFALVVLASAFALTRDGWSRVGALLGAAMIAGGTRVGVEALGTHAHGLFHLLGHGLELSLIVTSVLAVYYALDARSATDLVSE